MACLKNGVSKDSVINWLRFLRVGLFSMRLHCTCIILGLHVDLINLDSCTYFKSKVILNSKFVLQSFAISYFKLLLFWTVFHFSCTIHVLGKWLVPTSC